VQIVYEKFYISDILNLVRFLLLIEKLITDYIIIREEVIVIYKNGRIINYEDKLI
jgi:hypothetical protein